MSRSTSTTASASLPEPLQRLVAACQSDPCSVLGRLVDGDQVTVRVFRPGAQGVELSESQTMLTELGKSGVFEWRGPAELVPKHYHVSCVDNSGRERLVYDAYSFPPRLRDYDLHLFAEGKHWHLYRILGAHRRKIDEVSGVLFAVWAPNAERVSVVGDFNGWDGRIHQMQLQGELGVWELFIPDVENGAHYKFELLTRSGEILTKTDPFARESEVRPLTASKVAPPSIYSWQDHDWLTLRRDFDWQHTPISIYEVHLGSWRRADGDFMNYRELAEALADYLDDMGFTHVELMPITEHPLDASWGYQTTGYFAPTSRFGTPDDFRWFVDHLHQRGFGVILDWVPAHFPRDAHALARFDGTALFEHEDPRQGEHRDWGTLIFNYGRHEVKNFLLASALYWLEEFHLDGLRVDAVASMLYLDYSRQPGDWIPNQHGGNENLEAIEFLRELNEVVHEQFPGALMIAEESTAWPQVSRPTWLGGLGFSMKWNMGWMHDSLAYMREDPIYRLYHHDHLTASILYAFSENFVLSFSHDEVVHGKGSLLGKMPGDEWQRLANLRLLLSLQWTYPGKKLLFMGCEFGQVSEWDEDTELDWALLEETGHQGLRNLTRDLNRIYREDSALYCHDFDRIGFCWIDNHDARQSVLSYLRHDSDGHYTAVVLNFTPVVRRNYRIGLPRAGVWREVLNSDSEHYGGSNLGNGGAVRTEVREWMNRPCSTELTLPPLAAVVLRWEG